MLMAGAAVSGLCSNSMPEHGHSSVRSGPEHSSASVKLISCLYVPAFPLNCCQCHRSEVANGDELSDKDDSRICGLVAAVRHVAGVGRSVSGRSSGLTGNAWCVTGCEGWIRTIDGRGMGPLL